MVTIGTKVKFDPFNGVTVTGFSEKIHRTVIGTVVYIHKTHGWFSVEYMNGDVKQRTSFKFTDVGKSVHICK